MHSCQNVLYLLFDVILNRKLKGNKIENYHHEFHCSFRYCTMLVLIITTNFTVLFYTHNAGFRHKPKMFQVVCCVSKVTQFVLQASHRLTDLLLQNGRNTRLHPSIPCSHFGHIRRDWKEVLRSPYSSLSLCVAFRVHGGLTWGSNGEGYDRSHGSLFENALLYWCLSRSLHDHSPWVETEKQDAENKINCCNFQSLPLIFLLWEGPHLPTPLLIENFLPSTRHCSEARGGLAFLGTFNFTLLFWNVLTSTSVRLVQTRWDQCCPFKKSRGNEFGHVEKEAVVTS